MNDKKDEALKLALEALKHEAEIGNDDAYRPERDAIREALAEQPANVATVNTSEELVDKTAENVHEQPAQDNTYSYAKNLAEAIFKQHFASDEHYASGQIVWGVNDTVIGILTQIDNMVTDMVRRPAQQQEPVAHCRVRPLRGDQSFPTVEVDWVSRPVPGPLYTTPPASKPWVRLTDEEILACDPQEECWGLFDAARAIEAKLREKNA